MRDTIKYASVGITGELFDEILTARLWQEERKGGEQQGRERGNLHVNEQLADPASAGQQKAKQKEGRDILKKAAGTHLQSS